MVNFWLVVFCWHKYRHGDALSLRWLVRQANSNLYVCSYESFSVGVGRLSISIGVRLTIT